MTLVKKIVYTVIKIYFSHYKIFLLKVKLIVVIVLKIKIK